MAPRLQLHNLLAELLESNNVYFQPPPDFQMNYPCIVYNRSNIRSMHADDMPYILRDQYTITVIDANPDSQIPYKVVRLPECIYDRHFTADKLNHDIFNILF